jgi:hypothetical protein
MSTVVGDVAVKLPEPRPLKGTECEAKATGDMLTTTRRAKILGSRILM